jgi:nitroreductase
MNPHKRATLAHPIQQLILQRWSPYSIAGRPVSDDDLLSIFEASRCSASSYNEQPWRYNLAMKANTTNFGRLLSCLIEKTQIWARAAPVLALGCASLDFARNGQPNATAEHDLGLASATLMPEATVRELCRIHDGVRPLTGLAIGHADTGSLPEDLRGRDLAPRMC